MVGFADIFRRPGPSDMRGQPTGPNPTSPNPGAQPGGNGTVPGSSGMPNNSNPNADPNNPNPGGTGNDDITRTKDNSPLDAFKDIFTIDPEKQKNRPKDPFSDKLLNLDPKKLMETVGQLDFTKGLDQALVAKALQGDQRAFADVLNHTSRASFSQAAQLVSSLVEGAITRNNERWNTALPDRVRNSMLRYQRPTNTALSHEAAQPVLGSLRNLVASQFPELGPEEVAKKAEDYFLAMADAVTAGKGKKGGEDGDNLNEDGSPKELNWDELMFGKSASTQ